ncbi:translesion DNA synthesis-associated protein ImuA [Granulosicoccus sp.]|nr:translesion DNA synthesis-associated protein ImuA [Granulosicoccus sp.]MDB4222379.1 translesion DNA synthesis-associated protein ImuA [Granulosicoccus sp.]
MWAYYDATPEARISFANVVDSALDALLKSQPALWRGSDRYTDEESIPTGFAALDNALPTQGWCIGGVTEILCAQQGIGEVSLLLPALARVTRENQWAAFINPPHVPYAPALSNAGICLDRLLIIDSKDDANTLWAAEQVLRAGLFASVVAWVDRSSAQKQRRLQLAAETGKTWATVYRPLRDAREHSPVAVRLQADIIDSQLTLSIIKVRGGREQTITIDPAEFDDSQGVEWPIPGVMVSR